MTPRQLVDELATVVIRELERPYRAPRVSQITRAACSQMMTDVCQRREHARDRDELVANVAKPRNSQARLCRVCGLWFWSSRGRR